MSQPETTFPTEIEQNSPILQKSTRLTCAIGIVTYLRPEILSQCLRCVSQQTLVPNEIVIADASPNALEMKKVLMQKLPELWKAPYPNPIYLQSSLGITHQRNMILDTIKSDIIMFIDDDTLITPSYVEKIMQVFEADVKGNVGGIEGVAIEDGHFPKEFPSPRFKFPKVSYQSMIQWLRINYIGPYFPKHLLAPIHEIPNEIKKYSVIPLRNLYGCVMSYRTEIVKKYRFNEHFKVYCFMEDFDISYRIGKKYTLLRCLDALAQHLKCKSSRLHPSLIHYLYLINLAFIGRTAMDYTPELHRHLIRHAKRFVQLEFAFGFLRNTGFSQYRGAKAGYQQSLKILNATQDQLYMVYEQAAVEGFMKGIF